MSIFGVFIPDDPALHVDALDAFVKGMQYLGLKYRIYPLQNGYQPCDIAVTFGVAKKKTPRGRAISRLLTDHFEMHKNCSSKLGRHLVIERGFIHRDRYFMVGWEGLNGRANYLNDQSPADRWEELGVSLSPWRETGRHIVLCGQVPWDASVQHTDHAQWCRETVERLGTLTDRVIRFRPHPLQPDAIDVSNLPVQVSLEVSLQEDLQDAWAVVTFNSNAGVEATLAGVPAFVADEGGMGYSLLNKDLRLIESPCMPDRRQWLCDLAYTQWTLGEIASGQAMRHLWTSRLPLLGRAKLAIVNALSGKRMPGKRAAA